jgi:hypothetical protein
MDCLQLNLQISMVVEFDHNSTVELHSCKENIYKNQSSWKVIVSSKARARDLQCKVALIMTNQS